MDAKELRIGNLINFNNQTIEVTARFFSGLAGGRSFEDQKKNTELSNYHQPIPLTPEWLERFGFEFENVTEFEGQMVELYSIGNFELQQNTEGFNFYTLDEFNLTIKHVHQLQNLYYALTGEELSPKQDA